MHSPAKLALAFMAFTFAACSPEPASFDQAERDAMRAEVAETLGGLTAAMNSHEPEQIFRYFKQSEEFLYLGCTDVLVGWEAFSERIGPYYEVNPEVTFEQEILHIQIVSPTVAVAALRGSSSEAQALFWTDVLSKDEGSWKIVHEHESWPGCAAPTSAHPFTTVPGMEGSNPTPGQGG
jgi:hypothetical protein